MKSILACAMVMTLVWSPVLGRTASQLPGDSKVMEQEIRQMENERREAILRSDTKALDRLLATELTTITSLNAGRVTTKADELAVNESETRNVQSWQARGVNVRVYGNVGLVTGLADITDVLRGESRKIVVQYTHIWAQRDGKWQLIHRHVNRVSTIAGPPPR